MKKIVAISMVKNEMDIIESFVRHTLSFADLLIIADHKSTDRTREILEELQAEGLPMIIVDLHMARYAQSEVMTQLMREAAVSFQADLVLPLDADEFLIPVGAASVREVLEITHVQATRSLCWRTYATESDTPFGVFLLNTSLQRATKLLPLKKIIVSGAFVRKQASKLAQGNHYLICTDGQKAWGEQGAVCDGIELAHFDWRSPEQATSKFVVGWMNIVAQFSQNTMQGGSYRKPFREVMGHGLPSKRNSGESWEPCDLHRHIAMPVLRYSADTVPDVLTNVMAAGEALAEELAETRAMAGKPSVTTIVPYLRGEQTDDLEGRFLLSYRSARNENYPWHEILVPTDNNSEMSQVMRSKVEQTGGTIVSWDNLLSSVHGDYAEWLLPGTTVCSEKLRRMVACSELHGRPYALLLSDAGGHYDEISPCIDYVVPEKDNMWEQLCKDVWRQILLHGKYPSRGLAGVLVVRELFDVCQGLTQQLREGGYPMLSMWRELLLASERIFSQRMAILRDDFTGDPQPLNLESIAMHQLEWRRWCREDCGMIDEESWGRIIDRMRKVGIYLLEHAIAEGTDLNTGIWPAYQQMLAAL